LSVSTQHPLLDVRAGQGTLTWSEWRKLWEEAKYFEQYLSLLHSGFEVTMSASENVAADGADRICLYLELADGYWNSRNFRIPDEGISLERERAKLAVKAFSVIAQHFFKRGRYGFSSTWFDSETQDRVLEKLIWFFRLDERDKVPNLGNDRFSDLGDRSELPEIPLRWAKHFAVELCKLGWQQEIWETVSRETQEHIATYRPQLIELLLGTGNLDRLYREPQLFRLDEACWKKLEELAMRECWCPIPGRHDVERRRPHGIEESVANGSEAARVLVILRIMDAEAHRFEELTEALEEAHRAEVRLAQARAGTAALKQ
jgi:hypothetical protein